ncbi:MAG TPA: O-antigen ligase family protein [Dongiaceae bacterium]|nr:O-antigen ligase family protein [Dongiaceae bacterium]
MNPGSIKGVRIAMGALGLFGLVVLAFGLIALNVPPLVVLAVCVGGILLPIIVLHPEAGLHLFLFITFFESAGGSERTLTITKGAGVLVVVGWLLSVAVTRRSHLTWNSLVLSLSSFVAISALSIMPSYDNEVAVRQTLTYVQLFVIMMMVSSAIRSTGAAQRVLRMLVLGMTIASAHGLLTYGLGYAKTTAGFIGNRNLMAGYLAFGIPCAYVLFQASRGVLERLAMLISLPVQFLAMALTFSRTGMIVLGVVIMVLGYRLSRERGFRILAATALMLVIIAISLPGAFYDRMASIGSSVKNQEETWGERVELSAAGMRMIAAHPFIGVGAGNFPLLVGRYGRSGYIRSGQWASHNTYVGVGAESGLGALAAYVAAVVIAFLRLREIIRDGRQVDPRLVLFAIGVEASLVGFMVSSLSGNFEKIKFLYVFLGLVLALDAIRREHAAAAPAVPAPVAAAPVGVSFVSAR